MIHFPIEKTSIAKRKVAEGGWERVHWLVELTFCDKVKIHERGEVLDWLVEISCQFQVGEGVGEVIN
jgi:hypothetical protein